MDSHGTDYVEKQFSFGLLLSIQGVSTCSEFRPTLNQMLHVSSCKSDFVILCKDSPFQPKISKSR
jgi:hypothetical protein